MNNKNSFNWQERDEAHDDGKISYVAFGMLSGTGLGSAIGGIIFNNMLAGIIIGVCLGVTSGVIMDLVSNR